MAKIDVSINAKDDLTVFTVTGSLSHEDIIKFSNQYYMEIPPSKVLWDTRNGTVLDISTNEFRNIAKRMKELTVRRIGGKTAFVEDNNEDFGMGRLYESFAMSEELPVSYRVFRTIDDAKNWLFGS